MPKSLQHVELDRRIEALFAVGEGTPCSEGKELLRSVAIQRPTDFAFLQPQDLIDLRNSAFAGILEWEAFVHHYVSCELCNA